MQAAIPNQFFESERLASLFQATWQKLPAKAKHQIAQRLSWISDQPKLAPWRFQNTLSRMSAHAIAFSDIGTIAIVLVGERLAEASDRHVKFVIAHELAHVYLKHVPNIDEVVDMLNMLEKSGSMLERSEPKDEAEADMLAMLWKFSPERKSK